MEGDSGRHITIPYFGPEVAKSQLDDFGSVRDRTGVVASDMLF